MKIAKSPVLFLWAARLLGFWDINPVVESSPSCTPECVI